MATSKQGREGARLRAGHDATGAAVAGAAPLDRVRWWWSSRRHPPSPARAPVPASVTQELERLATRDRLTGLAGRTLLEDHLRQALHQADPGTAVAVLGIDVDDFRLVNETWGHTVGDDVLVRLAERLRGALRPGDVLCRWAGDGFVAVCSGLAGLEEAETLARSVHERLTAEPVVAGYRTVPLTVSVGLAAAQGQRVLGTRGDDPGDPVTAESLLSATDAAVRQAKDDGRDRTATYDPRRAQARQDQRRLVVDLRGASRHGELQVAYQPLVELRSGELVGTEALARWHHPARGAVPAEEFITLAEDAGIIADIGGAVLWRACVQGAEWNRLRRRYGLAPLRVSVNVSAVQLRDPAFPDLVREVLDVTALETAELTLEVTETTFVRDPSQLACGLHALEDLGVTLALDDFGTGSSSLAHLRQLPFHLVKIDRSFVAGVAEQPADRAIVRTIIGLARELDREVLAEGIESAEQVGELCALGCGLGQGYHFGRPVAPSALDPCASSCPRPLPSPS